MFWVWVNKIVRLLARLPLSRALFRLPALKRLAGAADVRAILSLPDRKYMEGVILPALRAANLKRILFVGCGPYTAHYPGFFAGTGTEFWTTDIVPENAAYGAPNRHVIGDVLQARSLFEAKSFDAIFLNGVFGYGVDAVPAMEEVLKIMHDLLKPGGALMVGWDRGLVPDPGTLENCAPLFTHKSMFGLPPRQSFKLYSAIFCPSRRVVDLHLFDWFEAR